MSKLVKIMFVMIVASSFFLGALMPLWEESFDSSPLKAQVYFSNQQSGTALPATFKSDSQRNGFSERTRELRFSTLEKYNESALNYALCIYCNNDSTNNSQIGSLFCQRTLLII